MCYPCSQCVLTEFLARGAGKDYQAYYDWQANVGIKIGGGTWTGGRALVDAQVTAYMMGMLQFWATGKVSTNTGSFDYQYAAYFYYNLGYKAKAVVLEWLDWSLGDRNAYNPDRRVTIYSQEGSIPLTANTKRTVDGGRYDNETIAMDSLLGEDYLYKRADGNQNLGTCLHTKPLI
jgi:hypothetical protein